MAYSGKNFALGFLLALVAGVVLGVIIGWYRRVRLIADPFLNALYATPRLAMMPLIIIWFGIGMWSKSVHRLPVRILSDPRQYRCRNPKHGCRSSSRRSRVLCDGLADLQTLAIPGSVPFILTGVRQGVALGLIGVVVVQMF